MSRSLMVRLGLLVVGLGVVCVGAVGVVAYMRLPTLAQQVPPPGSGVLLTLVQPVNGSSLNVGETVPVSAESTGTADVQSADLWVDGQDVGPGTPSSGAQPFSTYWSWSPAGPGEHTLSVHAELNDGSAITSNLVRVSAVKPTGAVSAAIPQGENPQPTPTPASGGNAG
ncbi:MAG: Ig-like domain-containing protein, partial [Anaerolineales bacterium]